MTPSCEDFERLASLAAGSEQREQWQLHLEGCAACRVQAQTDRALRAALAAKPELVFSPAFDATLRRRLTPKPRRSSTRVARIVLAVYVPAAAILSWWIVRDIDWPDPAATAAVTVPLALALLSLPLFLLLASPTLPWPSRR